HPSCRDGRGLKLATAVAERNFMRLSRATRLGLAAVVVSAVVAVGAMAASRLVHAPVLLWDIAWSAAACSALGGTILGRLRATGEHRFRWTMWVAACGCWLFGQLAWNLYGANVPPSPNLGDAGWWGFAVCATIGVLRTPARSRSMRPVAIVETVPL